MSEVQDIYAWVLDGVPTIYVTDEGLDDAWALAQGFVSAYPGLVAPDSLPAKVNLRALYPQQSAAKFTVRDIDGSLPGVFGVDPSTADDLVTTLEAGAIAGASLWNKHVGPESIGPAGERRRYSCIPGFAVGLKHLGSNEAFVTDGDPAPVSDSPVIWDGRRCALYRVVLEPAGWQSLADAQLLWYGTIRGQGQHHMRTWSFGCHGLESWAGANLGTGNFQGAKRCIPLTALVDNGWSGHTVMRAELHVVSLSNQLDIAHSYVVSSDAVAEDDGYLSGAATYGDIVAAVNLFLDDIVGSTTNGFAFDRNANDIKFETASGFDGITLEWFRGVSVPNAGDPYVDAASNLRYTARLRLALHETVWTALGYDVRLQTSERDPLGPSYGQFSSLQQSNGYWEGSFYAANPKAMQGFEANQFLGEVTADDYSSGGLARVWPPIYPGGAVVFDGAAGQEFQLEELDELRMRGSLSRPLMADPDDETSPRTIADGVGEVTHQGLLVLEGPYRAEGDEDSGNPIAGYAFEQARARREGRTIQVVRACWRAVSGLVVTDTDSMPRFVVFEWLDPRLFGFDYLPLAGGTWAGFRDPPPDSEPITARVLVAFEYSNEGDRAAAVLRRMLLTTGTASGWFADAGLTTPVYGLGAQSTFLDVGDNDDGADLAGDAEVASLGLGVPASLVASAAVFEDAFAAAGDLGRCKVASAGAGSAASLVSALLEPAGVALGWPGGKLAPFDAWSFPGPDDAVAVITPEDYGIAPGKDPAQGVPKQRMRLFGPIDKLELRARIEPVAKTYLRQHERTSSDLGAGYRAGVSVTQTARGDHLVSDKLNIAGGDWEADVARRWRDGFVFWAHRHSVATLTLRMSVGANIWPGDGVLVSDPWLLNTLGLYGVTAAAARVISRDCSPKDERIKFEVMIGANTDYRLYAPSAEVYRYDEQELGPDFRLLCRDDALDDRAGASFDVTGFAEPTWSTAGGDASVELFQFDGEAWNRGIFGVVASVAGVVGASTITLTGALTGAPFLSDRVTIVVLREFDSQAAEWVKAVYAPICDEAGEHSGGTPGTKWRGL